MRRSAASARPTRAEDLVDPGRVDGRVVRRERGDELERLAPGHPVVEARVLGEVADLLPVGGARRERDARDGRRAGGRPDQAAEDLEGGRLAGAIRAEEAVDRTGRHVEGQVRQGLDARIVLGEAGGADRRMGGHGGSPCGRGPGGSRYHRSRPGAAASSVHGPERWIETSGRGDLVRATRPVAGRLIRPYRSRWEPRQSRRRPGGQGRPRRRARPPAPGRAGRA